MVRKSFSKWIKEKKLFESRHVIYRPEISVKKTAKMSISLNDIIELGPETTFKGTKVHKLAKVVEIKRNSVEALDLSKNDGSRILIPIDQLYEKQDLTGVRLKPIEEKQLSLMGAKNLWVKLTPRQYAKYKAQYKEPEPVQPVSSKPEIDDDQVKFLKNWFMSAKEEDDRQKEKEQELLDIFGKNAEETKQDQETPMLKKPSPLARFIKKKNE